MSKRVKRKIKPSPNPKLFHCGEYCMFCKTPNGCSACKWAKSLASYERRGHRKHRNKPPKVED